MKIITIEGGCTKRNKLVGYQFNPINNKYYICGSYSVTPGSSHGSEEELDGEFLYGQYTRGCKLCGNKFVYQCANCSSFNCYDGEEQIGLECPVCGSKANVPATTDKRIVRSASGKPNVEIILAIDTSSSMQEEISRGVTRLDEMKRAAIDNFITKFDGVRMAVVAFSTSVKTVLPFTDDTNAIKRAVNSLRAVGGTASPFAHIRNNYVDFCENNGGTRAPARYIVVFTDGAWSGVTEGHVSTAEKLKDNGVSIITIGCAGADYDYLKRVASDGANIEVSGSDFGSAYATAATKISQ